MLASAVRVVRVGKSSYGFAVEIKRSISPGDGRACALLVRDLYGGHTNVQVHRA